MCWQKGISWSNFQLFTSQSVGCGALQLYLRDDHSHNALFGMKLNQFQHLISYTLEVMERAVEPMVTSSM